MQTNATMKPQDLFGLAIRIFGLYFGRVGLMYVYDFWYSSHYPSAQPSQGVRPENVHIYLVFAIVYLLLAIYFVAGAPQIMHFSYPDPAAPDAESRPSSKNET